MGNCIFEKKKRNFIHLHVLLSLYKHCKMTSEDSKQSRYMLRSRTRNRVDICQCTHNVPPVSGCKRKSCHQMIDRTKKRKKEFDKNCSTSKTDSALPTTLVTEEEEISCAICLDTTQTRRRFKLSCHHSFHRRCLLTWLKEKEYCPMCRTMPNKKEFRKLLKKQIAMLHNCISIPKPTVTHFKEYIMTLEDLKTIICWTRRLDLFL